MPDWYEPHFSGETYEQERDFDRLKKQVARVRALMADGKWRTLADISAMTGDPEASISARLRDLRKERFGSHIVNRHYVERGLFEYQLLIPAAQQLSFLNEPALVS